MQYYRCKCGESTAFGSCPPSPCSKCKFCGSDFAQHPDYHQEPKDHRWITESIDTDLGPMPRTYCAWCFKRKEASG